MAQKAFSASPEVVPVVPRRERKHLPCGCLFEDGEAVEVCDSCQREVDKRKAGEAHKASMTLEQRLEALEKYVYSH